jgi:charged multivesicular body protein 7
VPIIKLPLMYVGIRYKDLHSLPAYNTSSTSRLRSLYSDVSRQKHTNPASYRSTVHWWREVLQTVVLKHWLPQASDTLILHALPTLADSFRYEGAGKPLCLATVIVSPVEDPILDTNANVTR